jgi:hypothetical protein
MMKKRILAIFLCMALCIGLLPTAAFAETTTRDVTFEESLAMDLRNMGLFKGITTTADEIDFDLSRAPTRIEAVIMLIRLVGKETEALEGTWSHPFTDVPAWADKYVGYAYENGLTKGSSKTEYGTGDVTAAQYLTFVLRALGYSDDEGEDFTWDNPFELANEIGIIPEGTDLETFWRADVVRISYAALNTKTKDGNVVLAKELFGTNLNSKFYRYYDTNAFREHADWFEAIGAFLTNYGYSNTDSSGNTYYYCSLKSSDLYMEYTEATGEVSIGLYSDDENITLWFNTNGTVDYVYSNPGSQSDSRVWVAGLIFPEKYLELGSENLTQLSASSARYTSERRTVTVQLPNGNYTADLTYVSIYGDKANTAIQNALLAFRAALKDLGLYCDLADFGFTNTQTIGLIEQASDMLNGR